MAEVPMCNSSVSELSPDEERIMIKDIALAAQANIKEGDTFFLINQRFFSFLLLFLFCPHFRNWVSQSHPKFTPFLIFHFIMSNGGIPRICPDLCPWIFWTGPEFYSILCSFEMEFWVNVAIIILDLLNLIDNDDDLIMTAYNPQSLLFSIFFLGIILLR